MHAEMHLAARAAPAEIGIELAQARRRVVAPAVVVQAAHRDIDADVARSAGRTCSVPEMRPNEPPSNSTSPPW